ncbi:MAG TPA: ABC transporter permease [Bryobacteraceae bacterium]|jgi:putative ABC transport system permease protein|nr:ABC transporter permease [Bryobacteraceae bacterium]
MKYALRTLWNDRGFSAMVVITLAIGIGANTAIFSLVNGVLLRPLDFPDPGRLVALSVSAPKFRNGEPLPLNIAQLVEYRKRSRVFEGIAAYRNTTMSLTGQDTPELVPGAVVSANLFDVLGVHPRLGRSFLEQEDRLGNDRVVILADSIWRRRFGGDPSVIGRKITLGDAPYIVVGVLPPDFEFPKQADDIGKRMSGRMEMFRPLGYEPDDLVPHRGDLNYLGIARLRAAPGANPGSSLAEARAELLAAETAMDAQIPGESWHIVPLVAGLQQNMTGEIRRSLLVLMASVGTVLLLLCVNLASLALARAAGRARESAIRTAMGASRWQVARVSLAETVILTALGGGLGILVAFLGMRWLLSAAPADLPRLRDVAIDGRVLLFATGVSAITALIFGILPALRSASGAGPYETLKSTSYGNAGGPAGQRLRNILVAVEVSLCAALLVTAGLFLSSFVRLTNVPKGFDVDDVLTVNVALPGTKYAKNPDMVRFYDTVLTRARALPGVQSAAVASYLPLEGESWIDIVHTENDPRPESQLPIVNVRFVSDEYFRTLRIPLRGGRDFQPSDRDRTVAIVSESLARKLWPNTDSLGRRLVDNSKVHEVVGIASDARNTSLDKTPVDMMYMPYWQRPRTTASILVRTAMDPKAIAAALREVVWSAERDAPVPEERTLGQIMSQSIARQRFQMMLVLLFAMAALALAAFGTYGVVSYSVARRRAEIGIRIALGAQQGRVLRLVLRQGMTPVVAGLIAGGLAAVAIGKYVSSLLFEVSPRDPWAFIVSAAVLIAISIFACWIPARRAAAVNPLDAIRYE